MKSSCQAFVFPSIHDFPPFFTQQPTQSTWQHQIQLWSTLILSYYRHHKRCVLELTNELNGELFNNTKINRKLGLATLQTIIDELVKQGMAEWLPPTTQKSSALIYWRKPEEWANMIYGWVKENGLTNTVLTVFEVLHGENTEGLEFHGLDDVLFQRALKILIDQGKAQTLTGTNSDDMGVKFY
ncbi:subunit of ESCRT-II complex [Basidiobolus meristosporus CBS 931.73]|uniref:Vacuolar protein-sorting-associated protein 25 n=1 Tax=Basidiobolus meristosporus CBS 931.73 TaxID=1314790 RepID=A0A1Y1YQ15_9FUNG|nr:subunit of ESCRT-II complex [Basidiobolus meristosporus CBS 931.73]|eukprot:ORX99846.1 subunit of ESCRT-II complex [Basidiobolus meristosporus CBS 931.73]